MDMTYEGEFAQHELGKALLQALRAGNTDEAKRLVEAGAPINWMEMNKIAETALMIAARWADEHTVRWLLDHGADARAMTLTGATVVMYAIASGRIDVVRLMMDNGARVDYRVDAGDDSPLMWAASRGDLDIVKFVLDHGGSVETRNKDNETALHFAAKGGNIEIVRLMLDLGLVVDADNPSGETVLHRAAMSGNVDVVQLCLDRGADPNAPTERGVTVLQLVAKRGFADVAQVLLDHGADVNATTRYGGTPLSYAIGARQPEIVRLLLARGADMVPESDIDETARQYRSFDQFKAMKAIVSDCERIQRWHRRRILVIWAH